MTKKIAKKKQPKDSEVFVVECWRATIVKSKKINQHEDHDWFSLWCGFVTGLGYFSLATYRHYKRLGFPVEMEEL